ncbi:ABC transporter ATP-binding protein [Brevibacterium album]|uniref:ABC transporter ATP-binding protein n=1 Tax=Brevibacterium album TaxID=417948 RepID=UPI000400566E|nr:ABC transporter ATP-binding protein [Brevibacterium album]
MTSRGTGAALRLTEICKRFGSVAAATDISLDVAPGEFVSLLGPSGSGKTTTLNMIAGFEEPTSGRIAINDRDVTGIPIHRRNIGMVFQGYALFPHLTVGKNVEYPLRQHGYGRDARREAVARALETVSLSGLRDRMPAQLSGGQRQRVALARAIAYDPPLLLMDEPLSALDKALREGLQFEIRRIHRELGTTVVYVTHDQDEALALSDRIVVFNDGRVQQVGAPSELYSRPANDFVSRFLGESIHLRGAVRESGRGLEFVLEDSRADVSAGGEISWPVKEARLGAAQTMIRPENVTLAPLDGTSAGEGAPGTTGIRAVVRDVVYTGHSVKYVVECPSGGGVVRMSSSGAPNVSPGQEVGLSWDIGRARVLGERSVRTEADGAQVAGAVQSGENEERR